MTVIAWDGKTLAADRRATSQDMHWSVTKIQKHDGKLLFAGGDFDSIIAMYEWFIAGAKPETYPPCQKDNDAWAAVHVIDQNGLWRYERTPYPFKVEVPFFATGSGRAYAMAAMYCGKTAREAVEIACVFDPGCGNGIDVLEI